MVLTSEKFYIGVQIKRKYNGKFANLKWEVVLKWMWVLDPSLPAQKLRQAGPGAFLVDPSPTYAYASAGRPGPFPIPTEKHHRDKEGVAFCPFTKILHPLLVNRQTKKAIVSRLVKKSPSPKVSGFR